MDGIGLGGFMQQQQIDRSSFGRTNIYDSESQPLEFLNWELINQHVAEAIKARIEKSPMCADTKDKFASLAEMLMYPDLLLTNFDKTDVNMAIGRFNIMLLILDMIADRDDADSSDFLFYDQQLRFFTPFILKRTVGEMRERMLQNTQMIKQIVEESVDPYPKRRKKGLLERLTR